MTSKTTSGGTTRREFLRRATAALTALGVKGAAAAISDTASAPNPGPAMRSSCCTTRSAAVEEQGLRFDDENHRADKE